MCNLNSAEHSCFFCFDSSEQAPKAGAPAPFASDTKQGEARTAWRAASWHHCCHGLGEAPHSSLAEDMPIISQNTDSFADTLPFLTHVHLVTHSILGGKRGGAFLFIACQRRVKFLLLPSLTQCLAGTVPPTHAPWGCGTAVLGTQLPTPHARGPLLSPLHPP